MRKTLYDIDFTDNNFEIEIEKVGQEAIAKAHATGIPTTHGDGERLFLLFPDSHKEYINKKD